MTKVLGVLSIVCIAFIFGTVYNTNDTRLLNLLERSVQPEDRVQSATILLESMREITNLSLVESSFSEIYMHKDYWKVDIPGFQKEVIVKVNANVGIGYDLSGIEADVNLDARTIRIRKLPSPEILYIDDTIEYFSIEEGYFNWFEPEDFTNVDKESRNLILAAVNKSDLYEKSNVRLFEGLQMIEAMAQQMGWSIIY
jgi:hypothetical protein